MSVTDRALLDAPLEQRRMRIEKSLDVGANAVLLLGIERATDKGGGLGEILLPIGLEGGPAAGLIDARSGRGSRVERILFGLL